MFLRFERMLATFDAISKKIIADRFWNIQLVNTFLPKFSWQERREQFVNSSHGHWFPGSITVSHPRIDFAKWFGVIVISDFRYLRSAMPVTSHFFAQIVSANYLHVSPNTWPQFCRYCSMTRTPPLGQNYGVVIWFYGPQSFFPFTKDCILALVDGPFWILHQIRLSDTFHAED